MRTGAPLDTVAHHKQTPRAPADRLDEIGVVPGIDALTIGPTDVAQDLGVLGMPA